MRVMGKRQIKMQVAEFESEREALIHAILLVGSVAEAASYCDVTAQAVYKWLRKGLPAERVLQVEEMTGGRVPRNALFAGIDATLKRQQLRGKSRH